MSVPAGPGPVRPGLGPVPPHPGPAVPMAVAPMPAGPLPPGPLPAGPMPPGPLPAGPLPPGPLPAGPMPLESMPAGPMAVQFPQAPPLRLPGVDAPSTGQSGQHAQPTSPRPKSGASAGKSGKSKIPSVRAIALLCVAVIIVVIGVTSVGPPGPSVSESVKSFLLNWEEQHYPTAATMTTGNHLDVVRSMRSVYRQLGAQDLSLAMGPITVNGNEAQASFYASFDLGRGGLSWQYTGHFHLRRTGSGWQVVWAPSVIVPGLGPGDRLAVLTTMPKRGVLLDAQGHSLIERSRAVELGVYPSKVKKPLETAALLAKVVGLAQSDADEMAGQIEAWPPRQFLELIQLTPARYRQLRHALARVPALKHQVAVKRLFNSLVPVVTGQVATETARTLVEDGEPYRPGTTVGLSGLEEAFQKQLAGRPTTSIIVQNKAGKRIKVLHRWRGARSSNVKTTIDGRVQGAASRALSGFGDSATIVAVNASSGQILAVDRHNSGETPLLNPLTGQYQPGQTFTIVSTAALLDIRSVNANTHVPCTKTNRVGGQAFSNIPPEPNLGSGPKLSKLFAHACGTAFAGLAYRLSPRNLTGESAKLGIGAPWRLPIPAYTGTIANPGTNLRELAEDTVGTGTVRVSPLDMALIAGAVDSGTWRSPTLVSGPATKQPPKSALSRRVAAELRSFMRATVTSGAARAAYLPGVHLYGQVGTAPVPGHKHLRAVWFVGFRGGVAFSAVILSKSSAFTPVVQLAKQFAAGLPSGS
jgi:cell division protein FtsI/penicillin-binding protein 2